MKVRCGITFANEYKKADTQPTWLRLQIITNSVDIQSDPIYTLIHNDNSNVYIPLYAVSILFNLL